MRWLPLFGQQECYLNVSSAERIECRPTGNGWQTFAISADGTEHRLAFETPDVLTAEPETMLPARRGHFVLNAQSHEDGSIGLDIYEVVAWRIVERIALPICAGFNFEDEPHTALAASDGSIRELPRSVSEPGWGMSNVRHSLNSWLSTIWQRGNDPKLLAPPSEAA